MSNFSFDQVMEYSADNANVFHSIKENITSIVPFVGAGLSGFAYPLWKKFLENSFALVDDPTAEESSKFKRMMDLFQYEEAAEYVISLRSSMAFNSDIEREFSRKKLDSGDIAVELHKQATYLLPLLFKGLVLTTNFDNVIERAYERHSISLAFGHPGHTEILNKTLRNPNSPTLYKFHGDVSEVSNIIFTKESYDKCYAPGTDLMEALGKCFEHKSLLFLGCSLKQDRTMTVLERVLKEGYVNFTIISCKKEEIRKTAKELAERGIRAIFYPDGHHECVRVILERLLEVTDHTTYK